MIMNNRYYRMYYKFLHIYNKEHISYRIFKKRSIKKLNKYKKMLSSEYGFLEENL